MNSISESIAKASFERIRDQPYRVNEYCGDSAANCFRKSIQLIESLGTLGFPVRGRLADMRWEDTLVPLEIISLYPSGLLTTHFYVEVEMSGRWRCLDPSWDKALEPAGFKIADWEGNNSPGFNLVRVYDLEEQAQCLEHWRDPDFAANYFEKAGEFLRATNVWFEQTRQNAISGSLSSR